MVAFVFPDFQYMWLAEETKKNLPKELDFLSEGVHCERVAKLYSHFKFLKVGKGNTHSVLPDEIPQSRSYPLSI